MSYGVGDTGYMGQVNNTAFLEQQLATDSTRRKDNTSLDFEDMLLLLVTQLQNQSIDNQMDASDMMNQLIQMTVMQSLTEVVSKVEEQTQASVMTYAASLVGKEVTVGKYNGGKLEELVGTVTATGTKDGQQVIFINDEYYYLNEIMAVGRLPEPEEDEDDKVEGGDKPDEVEKPGEGENPGGSEKPDEVEKPGEKPEYDGGSGTPQDT